MAHSLLQTHDALVHEHDVALLDLDGVVYVGPDAVPGAPEALARARTDGMRLAFVTNNAARPPDVVAEHLISLGIEAEAGEVITSAQAASRYLADHLASGARVLVVGTTGLEVALRERGLTPVFDATGQVDAVVQGYSPQLSWAQLAEGAVAINAGALWVATNVDPTVPSPRGPLPGNGSLVAALEHATGHHPLITGKPDPTMHRETLLRTKAERPVVVGDRLDTDIEGANAVGCPSLLVLSGVTTPAVLLGASPRQRPSYLGLDVSDLLVAHRAPEAVDGGYSLGRWTARVREHRLELSSSGDDPSPAPGRVGPQTSGADSRRRAAASGTAGLDADDLDALRAMCAATWSADSGTGPACGAGRVPFARDVAADAGASSTAAALMRLGLAD